MGCGKCDMQPSSSHEANPLEFGLSLQKEFSRTTLMTTTNVSAVPLAMLWGFEAPWLRGSHLGTQHFPSISFIITKSDVHDGD